MTPEVAKVRTEYFLGRRKTVSRSNPSGKALFVTLVSRNFCSVVHHHRSKSSMQRGWFLGDGFNCQSSNAFSVGVVGLQLRLFVPKISDPTTRISRTSRNFALDVTIVYKHVYTSLLDSG